MNISLPGLPSVATDAPYSPVVERSGDSGPSVLRRYIRIARRWRWVIAGSVLAFVLLGLMVTLLMTPKYSATTTVEISRDSGQVTNFQGVERETSLADQEFYQTQYGLLRARSLAERVATKLRLADDPTFFALYSVTNDEGAFRLTEGRYAPADRPERLRKAIEILLDSLSIDPTRLSRLVTITFTSPDAAFSAKIANAWAENYIESNLERKFQATAYGREQLQRQLATYKQRLDDSQRQLVAYASQAQIINLPVSIGQDGQTQERSIVADDLAALNRALTEATTERIRAESRANQRGASIETLANSAINNLRQRRAELVAEYEQLMIRFEPGYPTAQAIRTQIDQLDRAISREEARVSGTLQADFAAARQREASLQERVNALKSAFLEQRRRSIQYNIYQQEVDTNQALYDGLLQRFKEIGVAAGIGVNNISVVDSADVPQKPSSPRLLLNLAISLIAGFAMGAIIALALEQLDDAIADPAEVERRLGLPLLGSIPTTTEESPIEALGDRKSEMVDAYLAVQTNLAFTTEHGAPRSLAVTSTRPGEGKSTTSLALATLLSRSGKRVILVDGDMRSPSVHQLGGVSHDRGLSNFLSGDDDIGSMTFTMQPFGFSAMSAGPLPPNAAELLTGGRLAVLLQRLAKDYDHVIIDSPPVMGLADAPLIASRAEGVVYVVESHGIRSTMVRSALARLASANVRIFGGVLTKFESNKAHGDYGYEYGYNYGRGAEAT